ncbi:MAG TPA: TAT-variant-translocated molybdopterin oxidoreductase [Thermoanaerobaculia bacterium]|jgi:molybdopterin-containing oxidoreductase family iron-sulfur binding subunit|nr:TAT-variant-translocated molybdopterin oxidoreductase [Thermoanaerobaculia bacterium]
MSDSRSLDFRELRTRIGDLRGKEYWRSLEDLARSDAFDDFFAQELPRQALPLQNGVDRRNFLKLMGASAALAGLAACNRPDEKIVPYVRQPENLVPGKPMYFASAITLSGYATGVLVESHMNRPTKIEGNPDHPSSLGASDAWTQASILNLYDPDRSQVVRKIGDISTWSDFIAALQPVTTAAKTNGAGLRLLTQTITSPTLGAQIQQFLAAYPGAKWHQWEPSGRDAAREGARLAFGGDAHVHYDFTKANVIVSLGSDFLDDGPGHLRYAKDFAARRRVRKGTTAMNRLYAIEASPTPTGSIADHRLSARPSQIEGYARAIAAGLGLGAAGAATDRGEWIAALVRDLQRNRGAGIVIPGDEQPAAVHAIAHAINSALGNIGSTVIVTDPVEVAPVNQLESLRQLVTDINAGAVQSLIVLSGNPVFDAPADFQFARAYDKVPFRAHLSPYYDETSIRSHWHVPEVHSLETWGDVRGHDGTVVIQQPLIAPLYNGRSAIEVLGALLGGDALPYETVRRTWFSRGANEQTWRKWLNDGLIAGSALPPRAGAAAGAIPAPTRQAAMGGLELEIRHDPTLYDGRFANNGWLQELPKPVTKIAWDNVALLSPKTAADLVGYGDEERDENVNNKRTIHATVSYRGIKRALPIWVVPGQPDGVVTVFYGQGRTEGGKLSKGVGFDIYPMRFSDALHGGAGVQLQRSPLPLYPVACTQEHQSIDPKLVGERGIIRAASFTEFQHNPSFAHEQEHEEKEESMYKPYDYSAKGNVGYAWAMSIDTSVCTGCNGCVLACQAENNIPIVGKEEVVREREMHWLRIDRYYKGDVDNPEVYHQPVPCMQCEQAPCEPVCPVGATSHSGDGLNDMTYNRCVGTRYCSNNCPYKVRRFNFFHYADYDTPALKPMRNPDVTVRTRGVMEKCTYCVQRINEAKITAEREGRRVRDGEFTTACAQACPTEAIVFGDLNDPNSKVVALKHEPTNYALLEELNTRPRTTYLATVRNPNPEIKA